jgi:glycerol-3-phosphate dehydrogenase (NAD(P)+)
MKIGLLGAGTWGTGQAALLANKGYDVQLWVSEPELLSVLRDTRVHPKLPGVTLRENITFSSDMAEVLKDKDLIAEAVTSAGIRPVFSQIREIGVPDCPIVITSKGIEQGSGLLLPEVAVEVLGEQHKNHLGCISGPSHAEEVIRGQPTSVVASAFDPEIIPLICEVFHSPAFRVYPNVDICGVSFGGAVKNVIGIACGMSDGLGFGDNTRAALMTRGLHEIRKLAIVKGCNPETLNGLAGMGDLCATCMSSHSRNYKFGRYLAEGCTPEEAQKKVGMVVEGAYTAVSAVELAKKGNVSVPICETVYKIINGGMTPAEAVSALMDRVVKQEHL